MTFASSEEIKINKKDAGPSFADLHIHTSYSDGTFSVDEVVTLAQKSGLDCISITDHDSVESLPLFFSGRWAEEIELIPGVELTAEINNGEVHILGYLLDYQEPAFQKKLKEIRQVRVERIKEMCKRLTNLGMPITASEVGYLEEHSCVGRLHLARLMLKKGFVTNIQAAFYDYIGEGRPAYVSGFRLSPKEAIELILSVKGVPVLAHPYALADQNLIVEFIKLGLMGIEAIYPEHTAAQTRNYQELARKYNLLVSGGSDCHGLAKPEVRIGTVKIPYELVRRIKETRPA